MVNGITSNKNFSVHKGKQLPEYREAYKVEIIAYYSSNQKLISKIHKELKN
jgi:hypothetical protein